MGFQGGQHTGMQRHARHKQGRRSHTDDGRAQTKGHTAGDHWAVRAICYRAEDPWPWQGHNAQPHGNARQTIWGSEVRPSLYNTPRFFTLLSFFSLAISPKAKLTFFENLRFQNNLKSSKFGENFGKFQIKSFENPK